MGIIITKFRKKKTTYEILERLDNEIKAIEEYGRNTEQTHKKIVGRFVFISVCVYIITALILYFYFFFPASVYERIIYIIPLIILPVLVLFIKKIMTWYYNRKIRKNQNKLSSLKDDKKKILDDVMDKETYKVAKKILERFAPEQIRKNTIFGSSESTPLRGSPMLMNTSIAPNTTVGGLRYRGAGGQPPIPVPASAAGGRFSMGGGGAPMGTPHVPLSRPSLMGLPPQYQQQQQQQQQTPSIGFRNFATPVGPGPGAGPRVTAMAISGRPGASGTPMPMARGILPRERSVLDKMVDYLVGDGPSNRYALICRNCSSHNGMALKEEFEYISFRCCYCLAFNPSRKKRPLAPKLDTPLPIKAKNSDLSNSDNDSSSSDSDSARPIITEPPETDDSRRNSEINSESDKDRALRETDGLERDSSKNSETDKDRTHDITSSVLERDGKIKEADKDKPSVELNVLDRDRHRYGNPIATELETTNRQSPRFVAAAEFVQNKSSGDASSQITTTRESERERKDSNGGSELDRDVDKSDLLLGGVAQQQQREEDQFTEIGSVEAMDVDDSTSTSTIIVEERVQQMSDSGVEKELDKHNNLNEEDSETQNLKTIVVDETTTREHSQD